MTLRNTQDWRDFIAAGRNKTSRPVDRNTTVRLGDNGAVAITLHQTDIVIIADDGSAMLDSGGWLTVTTKERINRFTRADIRQRGGVWYLADGSLFYDGMVINANGLPRNPHSPARTAAYEKKLKDIKKQAKAYAHGFVKALEAGAVDMPSGGDCWFCALRDVGGKPSTSAEHIRDHIEEHYYVPSLLVNAAHAAGYQDMQIGLMGIGGHRLFINPEQNIYKYVVKALQRELK